MDTEQYITIGQPVRYTPGYRWRAFVLGQLLFLAIMAAPIAVVGPPLASETAIKAVKAIADSFGKAMVIVLFLVVASALVGIGLAAFLQPLAGLSPRIESWFHELREAREQEGAYCFVVELVLKPKLRGGILGRLDDADDVGLLSLWPDHFRFEGDSICIRISWPNIRSVEVRKMGARGAWVYGKDAHLTFRSETNGRVGIMLRPREGWTVRHTRRRSAALWERIHWLRKQALEAREAEVE